MSVAFTGPTDGATVNGVIPIDIWVENPIGSSNTFTTSVDGRTIDVQTISERHANICHGTPLNSPTVLISYLPCTRPTGQDATRTISVTITIGELSGVPWPDVGVASEIVWTSMVRPSTLVVKGVRRANGVLNPISIGMDPVDGRAIGLDP